MKHEWQHIGQGERFAFGDPDKPYVVDYWCCRHCGKEVSSRGSGTGPAKDRCREIGPDEVVRRVWAARNVRTR